MTPFLSQHLIYPLQEALLNRPTFPYLKSLEKTQWLSRAELEALQLQKLQSLLLSAQQHSSWHAERIKSSEINLEAISFEELRKLPLMTRADAQQHGHEMAWLEVPGGSYR